MKKLRNILFANFLALLAVGSGLFLYWKQESKSESDNTPKPVEVALQSEGGENKFIRYETDNDDWWPNEPIKNDLENIIPPDTTDPDSKIVYLDKDKKINTVDEYLEYLSKYMFYEETRGEINVYPIMGYPANDLEMFMDWPYKGDLLNYKMWELFTPGNLIFLSNRDSNFIGEKPVEYRYTIIGFEKRNIETEKRVMQRCKEIAANVTGNTNQEKMENIGVILNSIADYELNMYKPEHLLFEGSGNCNAFMEVTDIIARYLGIPCGMVGNREMAHGWNLFIGSDGQLYEIDNTATWETKAYLMGNLPGHKPISELETELLLLDLDRRMLELHGKVELPPPSVAPIPPKQEEQTPQPSVPPSTEEQDRQPESEAKSETKPELEMKPGLETKSEKNEEIMPEPGKKSNGIFTYNEIPVNIGCAKAFEKISDDIPVPEIISLTSEKKGVAYMILRRTLNEGFDIKARKKDENKWFGVPVYVEPGTENFEVSIPFLNSGDTLEMQVRLCVPDIRNGYREYYDIYSRWSEPKEITIK